MRKLALPLVIVFLLTLAVMACAQDNWADSLSVNGYFQARYEGADDVEDEFHVRRMFTNLVGDLSDDSTAVLTFARFDNWHPDFEDDIIIYNMFVDYQINDQWSTRFGLVPTTFGFEAWQTSQHRIALERARILQGDPGNAGCGFYFGGASDRGLWLKRTGENDEPDAYFHVANGQFRKSDANSNKNVGIDLKWQRDWGQFGVSWLDGKWTNTGTGVETERSALDGYVLFNTGAAQIQAEYADGELRGADRDGWYVQLSKPMEGKDWMPYVKYEEFNAETGGACLSDYSALRGGVAWQIDEANELTAEIWDSDEDAAGGGEVSGFGLSWQASY